MIVGALAAIGALTLLRIAYRVGCFIYAVRREGQL